MKLHSYQLSQHLKNELASLYVISGDEFVLVQEACDMIQQAAIAQGYQEQQRYSLTAHTDWSNFFTEVNTFSLFSTQKLIVINMEHIKLAEKESKILQTLANDPPPQTVLLIKTPKLSGNLLSTAWYNALNKQGVCIQIWPLNAQEFLKWITAYAQKAGFQIKSDGLELIASACKGNLLAAKQIIEKLQLLYTAGSLSAQEIAEAVVDNARFTVFELADACLEQKPLSVIKILQALQSEGIEPILILWAITKTLRQLHTLMTKQQQSSLDILFQQEQIREQQRRLLKKCLQQLTLEKINALLQHALKIDKIIKGLDAGNVWNELQTLSLGLANISLYRGTTV